MMDKIDITRARVYVCTDKKCSNKNYEGSWLSLIHYKTLEEFKAACLKIHKDDLQPKIIYFETENIPQVYISSYWIEPKLFELVREVTELKESLHIGFSIWLNHHRPDLGAQNIKSLIAAFKFSYKGMFSSKIQFTYHYAEEKLGITKKSHPDFKFTSLASFLFYEEYSFVDGYVFKNYK